MWCCPVGEKTLDRQFWPEPHMSNSTNVQLSKHYQRELGIIGVGLFLPFENYVGAGSNVEQPKSLVLFNVICILMKDLHGA